MNIQPIKTKIFQEGENLFEFITKYIKKVKEDSIVVVTSKIVALFERRTAKIENIETKSNLIKRESEFAIPTRYAWLTIRDGVVMASAGIDESNANGKFIMLPKNSFASAALLRIQLQKKYKVRNIGVLITDSRTMPLRAGVSGVAVGYAGFKGIKDYRGKKDIFGRTFKMSRIDVADSLASSAVFVMGEGDELQPLALIEGANVQFCDRVNRKEIYIDIGNDMYRPLFDQLPK
ncbi:MAG: hypothetical protein UU76_C0012G0006 [Parcubacteria group bacterium GW2011_GWC1_41_7]|nr:MAG: hypothetical protein UU76_C0012G0006 [Parcubacteria group bacterium GW2011_GWC1_41_7]